MNKPKPPINNLFLLGAGFTRAALPNAPLNKDLLPVLCKGTPCTTLKRYYREHKTNDIEILLTHLDLKILHPKRKQQIALQKVRRAIEQQLAEFFKQFRFKKETLEKKENCWLKSFIKLFQENDAIISLNYDCFLEGLLDYHKVWCPSTGYGAVEVDVPGTSFSTLPNPNNIKIYKIHGAENFHVYSGDLKDVNPKRISLVVNEEIYPRSGKNSNIGVVEGRPYIIAPSFVKIPYPQIQLMMIESLQAASKAKNFIIIGCSLRPEDSHLWLFLTNFLIRSEKREKLIVVDPQADNIKQKICEHYGSQVDIILETMPRGLDGDVVNELISKLCTENA